MSDVPLGDFLSITKDPVRLEADTEYHTVGIYSFGRGLFPRPVVLGSDVSYSTYYRVAEDQFVYSKLFAWEGALAVVPPDFDGYFVSQEFPTFNIDCRRALPGFVQLLTTWPELWERVRTGEAGMGGRRKRVHPDKLMAVEVPLPDVAAQARIVDLMRAIDSAVLAADNRESALRDVSKRMVSRWASENTVDTAKLGGLASMGSGPSWKAADETSEPGPGRTRVIGITNTPARGDLELAEEKYVSGLPHSTKTLTSRSLLMIRTNGNRARIGNVYRVPLAAQGFAFSAFQIGLHFDDPEAAAFAYWMLSESRVQQTISEAASGTTGLGNVAVRWLKELDLPWPDDPHERARAVDLFDASAEAVRSAARVAAALRDLRGAVLSDFLHGERDLSDSYDELLERAS